ncbi:hypothetical protein HWV54_03680 [Bartonella alsatica]|nr:hypothetical protein [Bartonella alsatica]QLC52003.1 hypothetical protein HWV54_03680 [Bartonella alsatica]
MMHFFSTFTIRKTYQTIIIGIITCIRIQRKNKTERRKKRQELPQNPLKQHICAKGVVLSPLRLKAEIPVRSRAQKNDFGQHTKYPTRNYLLTDERL